MENVDCSVKDIPANLAEVIKGDQSEYKITKIYFLEQIHTGLGTYASVVRDIRAGIQRTMCVVDLSVLENVLPYLPPRYAKLSSQLAYVNEGLSVAFVFDTMTEPKECRAIQIINIENFKSMISQEHFSFDWRAGLINIGSHPNRADFEESILDDISRERTSLVLS